MTNTIERRAAKFSINSELIDEHPDCVKDLLRDVIIVQAEMDFCTKTMQYVGLADFFPVFERVAEIREVFIEHKNENGLKLEFII